MEQRLRALQSDFMALQQSYESLQCEKHQWLKEKAEHVNTMTNQTEKIALLEEQLNKLHNNLNPIPIISTNKVCTLYYFILIDINMFVLVT